MNHIKNHLLDIDHLSKDFIYDFLTETKKIKYSPETSKNFNHEKNFLYQLESSIKYYQSENNIIITQ